MSFKQLFITSSLFVSLLQPVSAAQWGYEGEKGPKNWAKLGPGSAACGGSEQSPIDLNDQVAIKADTALLNLKWQAFAPVVMDDGHSVAVGVNGKGGTALLDDKSYTFMQFHFHHGSEHTIDGRKYAAEGHFVHRSAKNGDLLVIAVLYEEGAKNTLFDTIWNGLPDKAGGQQLSDPINPESLVPENKNYFRYKGSLTTPGCFEIVTWHVLKETMTLSKEQISKLASRYPNNNRPVQALNRRYLLKGGD